MDDIKSRQGLLDSLRAERANLEAALDGLSGDQLTTPGVEGDWSAKDVVAHLLFWEQRALFLLKAARDGYVEQDDRWKGDTVDNFNARNYADQKNRPVQDVIDEEHSVFQTIVHLVESTPEDALIEPDRYEFTGGESLYSVIAGETFEHIREHIEPLQTWRATAQSR